MAVVGTNEGFSGVGLAELGFNDGCTCVGVSNDPGYTGIKVIEIGDTWVTSDRFHTDFSDVFHHTIAPLIDHN
jgi:hypothetical protein